MRGQSRIKTMHTRLPKSTFMPLLFAAGLWVATPQPSAAADKAMALADPPPQPAMLSHEEKMKWFREAKFGLFIHWGLYALPAELGRAKPLHFLLVRQHRGL